MINKILDLQIKYSQMAKFGHVYLAQDVLDDIVIDIKNLIGSIAKEQNDNQLPTLYELDKKAKEYSKKCNLENFYDADEIILEEMRYKHGYEQALKDFVNKNYNPDEK